MERLIRYGNIINDPLYNCSARTPESIANVVIEPAPVYGIFCFIFGVINLILYLLCVKVMLEPSNFVYPAYKIMIGIAVCDLCGTALNFVLFGIMSYFGADFCDSPNIIYVVGCVAASAWITGTLLSTVLIINRLVEINSARNKILVNIFNSKYTVLTILTIVSCGLYYFIFEPAVILHPKNGLTFLDPLIYENSSSLYLSPMLIFNNTAIVSLNSVLSICLCFNISKNLQENFGSVIDRRRQASLLFQCLAMVSLCNGGCLFYLPTYFFKCPKLYEKMAGILYQLSTNLPPYIYLLLNRSIRQGIIRIFVKYRPYLLLSIASKTMATATSNHRKSILNSSKIYSISQNHLEHIHTTIGAA